MSKNKQMETGFCKWCGQQKAVEIMAEEFDQQEVDELATWECDCQMARAERSKKERLDMVEAYIQEEFIDGREPERKIAWEAVMSVWNKITNKVTFQDDRYQYSVFINKEGLITITRLFKETREVAY